jgi:hypothetical protein
MKKSRARYRYLLFALALQLCAGALLAASGFVVARIETHLDEGIYMLDGQIDYTFSDTTLEALDNGVPLTLELHLQVRREDAWIWEENLLDRRQRYLIRYLPLTELYQVVRLPAGEKRSFVTRAAAISALGEIEGISLLPKLRLEADEKYRLGVKVSLDIEALPLPLRPVAYLRPSWNLSSGWTQWPLRP